METTHAERVELRHPEYMTNENQKSEATNPDAQSGLSSASLLDDTIRMNWLNANGRVSKFSDGWNAWDTKVARSTEISHDIRKAIDAAMRHVI